MKCIGIPELGYAEWSKSLHEKVAAKRIPISGSIELTFRCNNNCMHCYCNMPAYDPKEISRELSALEVFRIIDDIADEGCLWFLITGGEPLLRPDFKEIYLHAKKRGMLITLFTNGTLVNDEIADFLAEWRPFSVEITLYGATEKTYEGITRVKGSFRRCIKGIELLVERKMPLRLKTMAMRQNVDEIGLMKNYAEGLGLQFRFDPMVNSRLDMDRGPLSARLEPEEVVRLDMEYKERAEEWRKSFSEETSVPASDNLYTCGAGLTSFHIDSHGNLCICIMARKGSYNLSIGSFAKGWYNFMASMREKAPRMQTRCMTCDLGSLCGRCPGWSQIEHGDDEGAVDFLCEVAHKRAATFANVR